MRLEVVLLPRLLEQPQSKACLVVDVLRASSSTTVLLARGAGEIVPAASPAEARRLARRERGRYLLCGEIEGLTPRGFDYGNSPSEFNGLSLDGRDIILSTTNGTRALRRLHSAPLVMVGALLNASAAARALVEEATSRGLNAAVVCAGLSGGRRVSLEDAFAAGALAEKALAAAEKLGVEVELTDDALIACRLVRSYGGDALAAFHESEHGRALAGLGFAHDLGFCAQVDRFDVAPRLRRELSGRLTLAGRTV